MAKGSETRERVLQIAEQSVLEKGFGATSIEEIIAAAEITKSGFFYHFKDKNQLARAMLLRYLETEEDLLNDLFRRARELNDDPYHAFLVGLKLFAEMMDDLPNGHPGCLIATYCYQERLFDREIRELMQQSTLNWRDRFRAIFDEIAEQYPPQDEVKIDALADMVSNTVEGGIVMSKALRDPHVLSEQIMLMRSYIKLLFQPVNR